MPEQSWDTKVRMSAFRWLDEVSLAYGKIFIRFQLSPGLHPG
jgi:hypothetical protein